MSINGNSNVKTRQELITIINESEDQYVIRRAMDEPNADATVLDAAYERAKELCEEDKEKEYILSNVISDIAGSVGNGYSTKGSFKADAQLLVKIIQETNDENTILGVLCHENVTSEMIYELFKENDKISVENDKMSNLLFYKFPWLEILNGTAEDFEIINYHKIFNTQISKEVAMLYFNDYPTKFSQTALERFSKECSVSICLEDVPEFHSNYSR